MERPKFCKQTEFTCRNINFSAQNIKTKMFGFGDTFSSVICGNNIFLIINTKTYFMGTC